MLLQSLLSLLQPKKSLLVILMKFPEHLKRLIGLNFTIFHALRFMSISWLACQNRRFYFKQLPDASYDLLLPYILQEKHPFIVFLTYINFVVCTWSNSQENVNFDTTCIMFSQKSFAWILIAQN